MDQRVETRPTPFWQVGKLTRTTIHFQTPNLNIDLSCFKLQYMLDADKRYL